MAACECALGYAGNWEYRLASRVGLIGLALLPSEQRAVFRRLDPSEAESTRLIEQVISTSRRLIDRIPRLEGVVQILKPEDPIDGSIQDEWLEGARPEVGSTLLRLAIHWTNMLDRGWDANLAVEELEAAFPRLDARIGKMLVAVCQPETEDALSVAIGDLVEGMVVALEVRTQDGDVLVRKGQTLTVTAIEKLRLRQAASDFLGTVKITRASCPKGLEPEVVAAV
jgi:hypothetical protein